MAKPIVRFFLVSLVVFSFGPLWAQSAPKARQNPKIAAMKSVVAGKNEFAAGLYGQLQRLQPGNICFSPYSVSTALSMSALGARGNTGKQYKEVLHIDLAPKQYHPAVLNLQKEIRKGKHSDKAYVFEMANGVWAQEGYRFRSDFVKPLRGFYGDGAFTEFNLRNRTDYARKRINLWAERETNRMIPDMVPDNLIDKRTVLMVMSGVIFRGNWASGFPKAGTRAAQFRTPGGKVVRVPMMQQSARLPYAEVKDVVKLVELPYFGDDLSMVVILPVVKDETWDESFTELEKELSAKLLTTWLQALKRQPVMVNLPRFEINTAYDLNRELQGAGLTDAFSTSKADFSGMAARNRPPLYLKSVLHRVRLEVRETGVQRTRPGGKFSGWEFKANRPFIFLVRHRRTNTILFLGRILDPTK